jgi:hypothetical protein
LRGRALCALAAHGRALECAAALMGPQASPGQWHASKCNNSRNSVPYFAERRARGPVAGY